MFSGMKAQLAGPQSHSHTMQVMSPKKRQKREAARPAADQPAEAREQIAVVGIVATRRPDAISQLEGALAPDVREGLGVKEVARGDDGRYTAVLTPATPTRVKWGSLLELLRAAGRRQGRRWRVDARGERPPAPQPAAEDHPRWKVQVSAPITRMAVHRLQSFPPILLFMPVAPPPLHYIHSNDSIKAGRSLGFAPCWLHRKPEKHP